MTRASAAWTLDRGATVLREGVHVCVWAPLATRVTVHVGTGSAAGEHEMTPSTREVGEWEATIAGMRAGDRYGFRVNGGEVRPDPVSRSQPDGVHALSEVVDPTTFVWTDQAWRGLALADFVLYEIHAGTFTPEGTFDAIIPRLPELVQLGVTAIELMPVASFPGTRNWGYDGVHCYAPQASYGGPEGLKRLVNAAHAHGIAVALDVVYNHVGPEGNYLDTYGPYFTDVYRTPWGRAVNYDGPGSDGVRRWAHDNALYWLSEYHVDALRLDAVHGIYDFGALAFLEELSDEVHALGRALGRKMQLMAESDLNDPRLVRPPEQGGFGVDAQWADDFHHTLHASLTGECGGVYRDYRGVATMAEVYREPFFYARRYSTHRGRTHGRSSAGVPRQRFVVSAQNHDQVGNRPGGERLASLVPVPAQRMAAALMLLSPYLPLLFMGEEYGETAPFHYFIDHGDPHLVNSVREGRMREVHVIAGSAAYEDPAATATFEASRISWERRESGEGARMLQLYRDLLALRREEPALKPGASEAHVEDGDGSGWFTVLRDMPRQNDIYDAVRERRALYCAFNMSPAPVTIPVRDDAAGAWQLRYGTEPGATGHIPAPQSKTDVNDAPKRLMPQMHSESERATRAIVLPAWSAAVYVRDYATIDAEFRS